MPAKIVLVIDCNDPESLADFWAGALGYEKLGMYGSYGVLVAEGGPMLLLQRVPEAKTGKNRMHLDIKVPNVEAEVDRLVGLGAKRISDSLIEENGACWIVMNDPEGNEFCVCRE